MILKKNRRLLWWNRSIAIATFVGYVFTVSAQPVGQRRVEVNRVMQITFVSEKTYQNPFLDIELNAIVKEANGKELRIPAFWAGDNRWAFRYSASQPGTVTWKIECSDKKNIKLNGNTGKIDVIPYVGNNSLYRHGMIRVAGDQRHFAYADSTPFFWMGDTWWKGLCKRLTWEGFQELTADRKAKGFSVVQIVCGPYPDEGLFESRWGNEGGMPYETTDFSVVNPKYFDYADRRIECLVDAGIVPAMVGGWGRPDCDAMKIGLEGLKRHWRNLIARYGAYPAIWIIGGEAGGSQWTELAKYVRKIDPYHHIVTIHPVASARNSVTDEAVIDFDMLQTGHGDMNVAIAAIPKLKAAYARMPSMPAMIGEFCYEGHMQTGSPDEQRYVFWAGFLSGSAGLTYGAAGIWNACAEDDPGTALVYDLTTWRVSMNYPGSTQWGIGRKLLEKYPWAKFKPHPEWVDTTCYAAGIPGEVRFIYMPNHGVYNWNGPTVVNLDPDVDWHIYYFDPVTGRQFDEGTIKAGQKGGDKTANPLKFKQNIPSPQDWVLVFERVNYN